jgi:hypothetical protein
MSLEPTGSVGQCMSSARGSLWGSEIEPQKQTCCPHDFGTKDKTETAPQLLPVRKTYSVICELGVVKPGVWCRDSSLSAASVACCCRSDCRQVSSLARLELVEIGLRARTTSTSKHYVCEATSSLAVPKFSDHGMTCVFT